MQLTAHGKIPLRTGKKLLTPQTWRMMRMTSFLMLIAALQVQARGLGQTITANFKNASLTEVFKVVEKQTGYSTVFSPVQLENAKKVTVTLSKVSLEEALQQVFKDQPLTYQLSGRFIVVQAKAEARRIEQNDVLSPGIINIKGKVTDESGKPVAGAYVRVKGQSKGTITDERGEFSLQDIDDKAILIISAVNIETREVAVEGRSEISLVTKAKVFSLEDVTVSAVSTGYQTITKEQAAGSYSVVTAKDLAQTPTINILERLEGKVPGLKLDIKSNTIQIRSTNTYATNSAPLIVIDGFPQIAVGDVQSLTKIQSGQSAGNALFSYINPADIEQITFLKDAAATSIWGARGANGVIVIETKKGKKTAPQVNFNSTVGVSAAPSISKLSWMTPAQYIDLEQELVDKSYLTDPASATGPAALYTANNSDATEWMFKVKRGTATAAQRDSALAVISQQNNAAQIKKYLLQHAVNQQYNLSVSGGAENSTWFVSGNYNKDIPIFKSNQAQSAGFTANITSDFMKKRVTFRSGINYLYSKNWSNLAAMDALGVTTTALRPYDMLVDENGNTIQRAITMRPEVAATLVNKGYLPFSYNALDELNYSNTIAKENRIRLTAGLNIKATNWLNLDVSGMYQQSVMNLNTINELKSYASRKLVNEGTSISPANKPVYGVPLGGTYYLGDNTGYDRSVRAQLNFNKTFHKVHQFTALAGSEARETYNKGYTSTRYGYNADVNTAVTITPNVPYTTMYGWTSTLSDPLSPLSEKKSRYLSHFANASYSYDGKYIATGSMRFEDYTMIGIDRKKRAIPLWSAGLKWNAHKESFLSRFSFINELALRLTVGTGGSVPLAGSNVTVVTVTGTDPRTGQPIASIQYPANQDLGWETTKTYNAGLDISILNNRISANIDVYTKRSDGILVNLPYNATYGFSLVNFNTGKLSGHGIDLGITGQIIRTKNITWSSTFNLAYATNKVTDARYVNTSSSLVNGSTPVDALPIGYVFAYRWAGLSATGQSQIYDRNKNIISNTTNLTSAFTSDDLRYMGVRVAPYFGGFFNNFRYKQFELGVQMTYYMGHVFMRQSIDNYPYFTGYTGVLSRHVDLASRWKVAGDEANTNVPGLTGINFNSFNRYKYADLLVEKADNIRLQQVSLAYRLPDKWLPRNTLRNLSISANVRNLGIIWRANDKGIDPEYINTGNYSNLPPTTSYVFSLNASF